MGLATLKNNAIDPRPDISIGHIGLNVKNFKDSIDFFELVGARIVMQTSGMAIVELRGGTHIILRLDENAQTSYVNFDLMVDDIDEMAERLRREGYEPSAIRGGGVHRYFNVTDRSGLIFEITSSHVTGPV